MGERARARHGHAVRPRASGAGGRTRHSPAHYAGARDAAQAHACMRVGSAEPEAGCIGTFPACFPGIFPSILHGSQRSMRFLRDLDHPIT